MRADRRLRAVGTEPRHDLSHHVRSAASREPLEHDGAGRLAQREVQELVTDGADEVVLQDRRPHLEGLARAHAHSTERAGQACEVLRVGHLLDDQELRLGDRLELGGPFLAQLGLAFRAEGHRQDRAARADRGAQFGRYPVVDLRARCIALADEQQHHLRAPQRVLELAVERLASEQSARVPEDLVAGVALLAQAGFDDRRGNLATAPVRDEDLTCHGPCLLRSDWSPVQNREEQRQRAIPHSDRRRRRAVAERSVTDVVASRSGARRRRSDRAPRAARGVQPATVITTPRSP